LHDLKEIRRYIARIDAIATNRVRQHLMARINQLRDVPLSGITAKDMPEIRILNPTRYPYRIYYAIEANQVVVLHIRHTSRDAPIPEDLGY
jgi:plasmid stabilization system protein ParE